MRRYLLILVAVLGGLAAVAALSFFRTPTLGLDLQGGLEIVLQAEAPKGQQIDEAGMDRAKTIMEQRINRLGVAETEIRKQGTDRMLIELPGVKDASRAAEIVGTTAQLEFYDLEGNAVAPTAQSTGPGATGIQAVQNVLPLLTPENKLKGSPDEANAWYLFAA